MQRVRPGVELVLAILVPSRELITLDLPTLERPRKATSGTAGAGNWATLVAEIMNLARTRMNSVSVFLREVASWGRTKLRPISVPDLGDSTKIRSPGSLRLLRNTRRANKVMRRCPRGSEGIFYGVYPG